MPAGCDMLGFFFDDVPMCNGRARAFFVVAAVVPLSAGTNF